MLPRAALRAGRSPAIVRVGSNGTAMLVLRRPLSAAAAAELKEPPRQQESRLPKFLLKEAIVAPPGYNRYRAALPALATNICGGSVYAWSIFNGPLTRELGVVASSSIDWSLAQVVPVFSVNAACLGACTFATGKWLELVGPRAAGAVSQCRTRPRLSRAPCMMPEPRSVCAVVWRRSRRAVSQAVWLLVASACISTRSRSCT
jgi:hypothetical protein